MSSAMVSVIIIGVFGLLFVFLIIGIYNKLVRAKNACENGFSQIDVQLQRRYDLIPNLVETAKKYMEHEKETLVGVIEARNQALASKERLAENPGDASATKNFSKSEAGLNGAMSNFLALFENYPDLKANQNMQQLTEELSTTENKIAFARQAFNDAIMSYNVAREEFPAVLIAGLFGFQHKEQLEIEDQVARKAVKVEF
ncbi:MAG: hypothetical protein CME62_13350 [Halobacteriovoraceae bacterium]|nr:hypothetical protein [Halobacteriovoraceae bacterium]|tara:strand:- start:180 stop:779 length:600 start_codon:yes stop_codon:yes gene_type:complete